MRNLWRRDIPWNVERREPSGWSLRLEFGILCLPSDIQPRPGRCGMPPVRARGFCHGLQHLCCRGGVRGGVKGFVWPASVSVISKGWPWGESSGTFPSLLPEHSPSPGGLPRRRCRRRCQRSFLGSGLGRVLFRRLGRDHRGRARLLRFQSRPGEYPRCTPGLSPGTARE